MQCLSGIFNEHGSLPHAPARVHSHGFLRRQSAGRRSDLHEQLEDDFVHDLRLRCRFLPTRARSNVTSHPTHRITSHFSPSHPIPRDAPYPISAPPL
eukprot:2511021-Rhodomonas_salina.2